MLGPWATLAEPCGLQQAFPRRAEKPDVDRTVATASPNSSSSASPLAVIDGLGSSTPPRPVGVAAGGTGRRPWQAATAALLAPCGVLLCPEPSFSLPDDKSELEGSTLSVLSAASTAGHLLPPQQWLREKAFEYCQRLLEQSNRRESRGHPSCPRPVALGPHLASALRSLPAVGSPASPPASRTRGTFLFGCSDGDTETRWLSSLPQEP